ncbi:MAG: AEC family transporter [Clostridia bacterium]|nr:AEC family transporter [Clostridia bacterium]
MIDIGTVFTQTLMLCILLIPGFLFRKLKIAPEEGGLAKGISNIILYVAQPAMLISPYIRDFDSKILVNMGFAVLFSFLCHTLFMVPALLVFGLGKKAGGDEAGLTDEEKRRDLSTRVLRFAAVFGNCGYMGIPLIRNLLGDEATVYATVFNIGFQIFLWTFGCLIATGNKKYVSFKKIILNPATISIFIGLIMFFTPLNRYVPGVVTGVLDMLKETVLPLSMFVVGFHMAGNRAKSFFTDGRMWVSMALKLLACPLLSFGLLKLFSAMGIYNGFEVAVTVLLCSATPCATVTSIFSEKFDLDRELAGRIVPLSTLISMATLPLVALLLKLL